MNTKIEVKRISDVIIWETAQEHGWCRSIVTFDQNPSATTAIEVGTVLQDSEETGYHAACTVGASANAILLQRVSAAELIAGDVDAVALVRGPAIVKSGSLTIGGSGQTAAALSALGILLIDYRTYPAKQEEGTTVEANPQ